MAKEQQITVRSMVGARTGAAAVSFRLGDRFVNLSPDDARKVGIDLISAADRGELEAGVVALLRAKGAGDQEVGQFLALLRDADKGDDDATE